MTVGELVRETRGVKSGSEELERAPAVEATSGAHGHLGRRSDAPTYSSTSGVPTV